jgi:hypothetical protein
VPRLSAIDGALTSRQHVGRGQEFVLLVIFALEGTARTERHDRRLGHINLSPQAVSHVLPLVKVALGQVEGVEFFHQLPETLQVVQDECDVGLTQGHEWPSVSGRAQVVIRYLSHVSRKLARGACDIRRTLLLDSILKPSLVPLRIRARAVLKPSNGVESLDLS